MSQQNMNRLEAVNRILRAAREHPVSSLGSGNESDTLMAEQVLNEITQREQMVGVHENQTVASFVPASDGRVILPNNAIAVKGWNEDHHRNFFLREHNGQILLYDADKAPASPVFTDDKVWVRLVQSVIFDNLPLVLQFSIVDQAAVENAMAVLPSNSLLTRLEARAARSRAMARAADIRGRPSNLFNDSRSTGLRMGTVGVPRPWYSAQQPRSTE